MPVTISWVDVSIRLVLTLIASALIGFNRTERGRPAGLRTTMLVCLAASVSMIQVNLLMPTNGKPPDSYAMLDLMRLPLGILTGMGFIGAGAIMKRGDMVQGVTTAATLWLTTIIGLCLGGGQLELGMAATALALAVLGGLKKLEQNLRQDRHATLIMQSHRDGPSEEFVRNEITSLGYRIGTWDITFKFGGDRQVRTLRCEVRWHGRAEAAGSPEFLERFKEAPGILAIRWTE